MSVKSERIRKVNSYKVLSDLKFRLIVEGIFVGLITGVIVSLFRFILQEVEFDRQGIINIAKTSFGVALLWILVLIILLTICAFIVRKEPLVSGSGIPQVKGELVANIKPNWLRVLILKFFGSICAISAGLSLGREGPSIQLGAMVGKGMSRLSGRLINEEKYLVMCGAGAGLAAAFGAPLAGVIFVLEEIKRKFSHKALLCTMSGAITADWVASRVFGLDPVFNIDLEGDFPLKYFWVLIIFGILLGICSAIYIKATKITLSVLKPLRKNNIIWILTGLIIIGLAIIYPSVLGSGHSLIETVCNPKDFTISSLFVLLIIKFLFSIYSFGTGAPGGTLQPILVIGGIIGSLFGMLVCNYTGIPNDFIPYFVVFGMVGYFSGIVRSPITGILIITEITGMQVSLFHLAIPSLIAYIIAELLHTKPVYDMLLDNILRENPKYVR